MSKILVFLENKEQYSEFLKHSREFPDGKPLFCPLTPAAIKYCEDAHLTFILAEDCFREEEHYKAKEVSELKIKELVRVLNDYYGPISKERIGYPLEIGNYFYNSLYVVLGGLHLKSFLLSKVIEKENPDKVVSFSLKVKRPEFLEFRPHPLGDTYAYLLRNSQYRNICYFFSYKPKKTGIEVLTLKRIKNTLRHLVEKLPLLYQYYYFKNNGIRFSFFKYLVSKKLLNILMLGPAYNWKYVINSNEIQTRCRIKWLSLETIAKPTKLKNKSTADINYRGEFFGFDILPLIIRQLSIIQFNFNLMLKLFNKYRKEVSNVRLVIASVLSSPWQNYFAHIAKGLRVPVVLYQHGEMNLYPNSLFTETTELSYLNYYLSFGDSVNCKFNGYIKRYEAFRGSVSIGSAMLDNLTSVYMQNGKYILYATGKYLLNSTPFIHSIGPDIRLFEAQKKLLVYLENLSHSHNKYAVIWKLNNTPVHDEVPFVPLNIKRVCYEKSFSQLIPDAYLIILDAPGTTCLEACATNKPLFVLLNRIKWFPEAEESLKLRAVVAYTPGELISKLDDYINRGIYTADLNNRDFVKSYGTYLDDGRSKERALDFIFKLVDKE